MDAIAHIRADLDGLRRRRRTAVALFLGLMSLAVAGLLLGPQKPQALPRTSVWAVTLAGLFLSSTAAIAAGVGVPLFRARMFRGVTVAAGLGLAGAFAVLADWDAPMTMGVKCLAYGTFVSAVAMILLGALSGRLWRRFPDPGWILALGIAGTGAIALHFSCAMVDPVHLYLFHLGPVLLVYALVRSALKTREALLHDGNL